MATEDRITFCRICEPLCGLVATVEDGRLVRLRPDREHPLSKGFACPKGIAMTDVQNDPDRVLHPLRRKPDGEFEQVSWETALDDIGRRLRRIRADHGGDAIGWYFGNPGAFSYSHAVWLNGFMKAIRSRNLFTSGSQDINNRFVASRLLYGSVTRIPIPDLPRTDFLLIVGANPLVSHGSAISAPRIRDDLKAITKRGGRIVVVDPRRSETAREFEHLPIRPDGDAWLLLSLLQIIFAEGLADERAIAAQSRGARTLRESAKAYPPEATQERTGLSPDAVRTLARDLAAAPSAAVYGRTGSCLGRHGTLVAYLLDALNLVTGNLDRPGGAVFGGTQDPLPFQALAERFHLMTYGRTRSRIGGFPDVLGSLPAAIMAKEMTTEGPGRIRAMFVSAGNPVLSVPSGEELAAALRGLELLVSLDLYVTDTNQYADYILPTTTFLEREDIPLAFTGLSTTPFVQWTDPVVQPYGEARQEWQIIEALTRAVLPFPLKWIPLPTPQRIIDIGLRLGRRRLTLKALRAHPHGLILADRVQTGVLRKVTRGRLVRLDPPEIVAELARLGEHTDPEGFPLRLIGLRELRSQNSWMHNAETLMRGSREHTARVHPKDAAEQGLQDGATARITSPHGSIEIPVRLTDEVREGTVAIPHGWGHRGGGWRRANQAGGVNVNLLTSSDPEELERPAGMAHLNGVPIRLEST